MLPSIRIAPALVAVLLVGSLPAGAELQRPPPTAFVVPLHGYRLITRVNVEPGEARESIDFTRVILPCTAVALRARASELDVLDVLFTFADRTTFSPTGVLFFREGAMTRELAQPDQPRPIRSLDVHYRNAAGGRAGQLEVWGK
jgi:hypothetical protein